MGKRTFLEALALRTAPSRAPDPSADTHLVRPAASRKGGPGLPLLVALFLALGILYSLSVPLFEAPDEIWHFNFIRVLATERSLPVQPSEGKDMWLREAGQPPLYHILSALLIAPLDTSDFPGWVRWNVAHPAVSPRSSNPAPNVFIHTDAEAWPWRRSALAVYLVRWSTLLWGAGAVIGTVLIARQVLPGRPGLALAAGALTALTPHLLFISSVINNDATAACLCTFTLWACIRLVQDARPQTDVAASSACHCGPLFPAGGQAIPTDRHGHALPNAALLGLLLGLSLLSKMSALALLPLVALALALAWWNERAQPGRQRRGVRAWWRLLLRAAVTFGLALLVSGWWFARNWRLYGDPLGWSMWLIDIGVQRITLDELIRQFGHVATSYVSPYDGLLPQPVFWALGVGLAIAAVGWVRYLVSWAQQLPPLSPPRKARGGEEEGHALAGALSSSPSDRSGRLGLRGGSLHVDHEGLLLSGAWLVLLVASLVRYMTTTPSAEGRLLYPGIAAASLLLALGWTAILPRRWVRPAAGAVIAALLILNLATPLFAIAPRFARPLVTDARELEGLLPVEGGEWDEVRLLGVRVEPEVAAHAERVDVRLYWEVLSEPSTDLRAVVRLQTAGGRLLTQWNEQPANERYPVDMWRAGEIVRDDYSLPMSGHGATSGRGPALYRVSITLTGAGRPPAQTAHVLKLAPGPLVLDETTHQPASYTLGDRAALTGYALPEGPNLAGGGLALTLYWEALAEMEEDYTVFVHLVAPDGTLLGQGDGAPLDGDYPTSWWAKGEALADPRLVQLREGVEMETLPTGSYLLVGLYRMADGTRLPVVGPDGARAPDDAIRIDLDQAAGQSE